MDRVRNHSNRESLVNLRVSLSDLSSSPGALSGTSTGNTSPESFSPQAGSFFGGSDGGGGVSIEDKNGDDTLMVPGSIVDRHMLRGLNSSGGGSSNYWGGVGQQHQQLQHPSATVAPPMPPTSAPRGSFATDWRANSGSLRGSFQPLLTNVPATSSLVNPSPTAAADPTASPTASIRLQLPSLRIPSGQDECPLTASAYSRLGDAYAYCYDRGDGHFTRLIPADMLPPLVGIPASSPTSDNMIVLPQPCALPTGERPSNTVSVHLQALQAPSTPAGAEGGNPEAVQSHIDNIIAASPTQTQPKRTKVYCDKWVHEGVCAFTQQGCKYRHEMPHDRATQHSLGLFQGYPQWWKRQQAELARQCRVTDDGGKGQGAGGEGRDGGTSREQRNMPIALAGRERQPGEQQQQQQQQQSAEKNARLLASGTSAASLPQLAPTSAPSHVVNFQARQQTPPRTTPLVPFNALSSTRTCQYGPIGPPSRTNNATTSSSYSPSFATVARPPLSARSLPARDERNYNPYAMLDSLADDLGDSDDEHSTTRTT